MERVTMYSSAPETTQLACALAGLRRAGVPIVVQPTAQVPTGALRKLRARLLSVTLRLVGVADQLNEHELGRCRLDAGAEQGLRFERDGLQARQRGILASIQTLTRGKEEPAP